jgi:hypothetical protein
MIGRRLVLRLLAASPFLGGSSFRRAFAAEPPTPTESAALYRKAFAGVEALNLDSDERSRLYKVLTEKIDRWHRSLIERAEPALENFRLAALAPRCDWNDATERLSLSGDRGELQNVSLGRLLVLRARIRASEGRGRQALDDAFAVAAFGRHFGTSGMLIQRLFQISMENQAISAIGQALPKLALADRESLPRRIASLPPLPDWNDLARCECRFIAHFVNERLRGQNDPVTPDALLTDGKMSREDAEMIVKATGGNLTKIQAMVQDIEAKSLELAEVLETPLTEFRKRIDLLSQRLEPSNPILASAFDSIVGVKYATDRTAVLWTMLRAANLKVEGRGNDFKAIVDPYGTGPFDVRETAGGFELRSALNFEERLPAVLVIGEQ